MRNEGHSGDEPMLSLEDPGRESLGGTERQKPKRQRGDSSGAGPRTNNEEDLSIHQRYRRDKKIEEQKKDEKIEKLLKENDKLKSDLDRVNAEKEKMELQHEKEVLEVKYVQVNAEKEKMELQHKNEVLEVKYEAEKKALEAEKRASALEVKLEAEMRASASKDEISNLKDQLLKAIVERNEPGRLENIERDVGNLRQIIMQHQFADPQPLQEVLTSMAPNNLTVPVGEGDLADGEVY